MVLTMINIKVGSPDWLLFSRRALLCRVVRCAIWWTNERHPQEYSRPDIWLDNLQEKVATALW